MCARAGRAREALDALARMSSRGAPLEPYTLASVLTACRGGGGEGLAAAADDEGEYLALSAEAWEALELFERAPPSASETTAVRNAAIALCRGGTNGSSELYDDESGRRRRRRRRRRTGARLARAPDTITYNTLIAACASSPRPRARRNFTRICSPPRRQAPTTRVSLMTSAARAAPAGEGPDAALAWFAEHETDPTVGSPNAFAYTALIDAQAKGGLEDAPSRRSNG